MFSSLQPVNAVRAWSHTPVETTLFGGEIRWKRVFLSLRHKLKIERVNRKVLLREKDKSISVYLDLVQCGFEN